MAEEIKINVGIKEDGTITFRLPKMTIECSRDKMVTTVMEEGEWIERVSTANCATSDFLQMIRNNFKEY